MESLYVLIHHEAKPYGTSFTQLRRDYAHSQKSHTVIASFGRGTRRAIRHKSKDGSQKTARKWRGRKSFADKPMGRKNPRSTSL